MTKDVARYTADAAMYDSEPMPAGGGGRVVLLNATPDPLGSVAALCKAYKGEVVRDLADVTDDERRSYLDDMGKTVLNGPLEAVQFHFLVEGWSRALVDQMTRGRAAFYAVESLRFAVKNNYADEVPTPPFLAGLPDDDMMVRLWRKALVSGENFYHAMIANGVPAEDARRLLPIGIATRAHWVLDLRELLAVAGKRLCTQAEFEWRDLMAKVAQELRKYRTQGSFSTPWSDRWQFAHIAARLRPVCYQTGHCGFMAKFDRGCTIRGRVEAFAAAGIPSEGWASDGWVDAGRDRAPLAGIKTEEWLLDPGAAR